MQNKRQAYNPIFIKKLMEKINDKIQEIIESLSPLERKIIPFLNSKNIKEIERKSQLDEVSAIRALRFLENKGIVKINVSEKIIIEPGTNGIYYKKHHLPERNLLILLELNNHITIEEAKRLSKLSENEFKAALGVLKDKALISLSNGKINLRANKEEIIKKSFEEQLLEILPIELEKLNEEMKFALNSLKKRKDIVEIKHEKSTTFELTSIGWQLEGKSINLDLIEEVTPKLIAEGMKNKKFRKYDIFSPVPRIYGGKRHFVNQSIGYAKQIWLELGFQEMSGPLTDSSFWIFDALFTPQDHPARELQDTFFIKDFSSVLPDKKIVENVKKSHELGVAGSKGWNYSWQEKEAKKTALRTHTTSLSARTLAKLSLKELPAKYFAIGKVFRNETIDSSHLFEFYQSEGIVIDKNANFSHLLGYLKAFLNKMGFKKVRFRPHFFPYTEPSAEADIYDEKTGKWTEILGAGMLRPEVVVPLFGKYLPVLAWGMGVDRMIKENYDIKDLREIYSNNLKDLREKRFWIK